MFSEDIEILVIYAEKLDEGYLTTPYFTYDLHTLSKLGELSINVFSKIQDWIKSDSDSNY